jgi:hypothetical protein
MKNAIIIHGMSSKDEYYSSDYPSASNSHWIPWLQKQFLIQSIAAQTPEMPDNYTPNYSVWSKKFECFEITPETILVGHSCGAGFLVRWLSEHKDIKVGKVILVAPWIDPENELTGEFFDFKIDKDLVSRTKGMIIFNSDNDSRDIQKSVEILNEQILGMETVNFHSYGHFCLGDMGTTAFPELLEKAIE